MSYFNIFNMSYFKISAKDVLLHSGMENMNYLFHEPNCKKQI